MGEQRPGLATRGRMRRESGKESGNIGFFPKNSVRRCKKYGNGITTKVSNAQHHRMQRVNG